MTVQDLEVDKKNTKAKTINTRSQPKDGGDIFD